MVETTCFLAPPARPSKNAVSVSQRGWTVLQECGATYHPSDKKVSDTRTTSCSDAISAPHRAFCKQYRVHQRQHARWVWKPQHPTRNFATVGYLGTWPNTFHQHIRFQTFLLSRLLEAVSRGACPDCSGPRPGGNQCCLICFGPLFFCLPQLRVEVRAGTSFVSLYFSSASRL